MAEGRFAWQVISPRKEAEYPPAVRRTHDWTLLERETSEVGQARQAAVGLIQEGAGQSWFDDLEIAPMR